MRVSKFFLSLVTLLSITSLFFTYSTGYALPVKNKSPNVIVILTDDQGWGDLSINGNKNLQTPNIDLIGKKGATFNHFYVSPVCSPTRAELLTGRYHSRSGVYSTSEGGERINLDETTIAEVFKKEGYATAAFGKWHNGMQYPYHPNARGFEKFYGFCSGHWGNYFSPMLERNGKIVQGKGFIIDDLTDNALDFIQENQNKPFFLYVSYNTPHSPMQVPDKWWDKFKDKELTMRADKRTGDEDDNFTRAALAMCENIDWNVGRIQDKLQKLKLDKETIIVYLSDNGPNSSRWNGGMKGRKGSTDEGGIKSPLMIKWSGKISPGFQINQIAGAIDLLPTLADLTDLKYQSPKSIDGRSLKPLLLKSSQSWPDRLLFSHWAGRVSVRSQRYRLDHEGKLFDIDNDPGQLNDVSIKEPEITRWLTKAGEDWKSEVMKGTAEDKRPFPVGHGNFSYTQLPARDGKPYGSIVRSSKHPNSSFFTNWKSTNDSITWNVEVLTTGNYQVEVYYTCPVKDVGSTLQLSMGPNQLKFKVIQAHDSPLIGREKERVERTESYEKDFKTLKGGIIHLKKGSGNLTLQALNIPGPQAIDFRLLMLTKLK